MPLYDLSFPPLSVLFRAVIWIPVAEDYSVGFGGKFGIQRDRQDKSALGWDHQEEMQPHESQTGRAMLLSFLGAHTENQWLIFDGDPAAEHWVCAACSGAAGTL